MVNTVASTSVLAESNRKPLFIMLISDPIFAIRKAVDDMVHTAESQAGYSHELDLATTLCPLHFVMYLWQQSDHSPPQSSHMFARCSNDTNAHISTATMTLKQPGFRALALSFAVDPRSRAAVALDTNLRKETSC